MKKNAQHKHLILVINKVTCRLVNNVEGVTHEYLRSPNIIFYDTRLILCRTGSLENGSSYLEKRCVCVLE